MTQTVAEGLARELEQQRVINWVHSTGTPPRANGTKPDPLCQEAAAELRRLAAVEAERDALRAALTRVLDAHAREAKAYLTAKVASENFSRRSAKADEHAHFQAAMESSKAEKEARELLAAMKGNT